MTFGIGSFTKFGALVLSILVQYFLLIIMRTNKSHIISTFVFLESNDQLKDFSSSLP